MPKRIMPLSEIKIRTAKPKEKPYKISDVDDLYLFLSKDLFVELIAALEFLPVDLALKACTDG